MRLGVYADLVYRRDGDVVSADRAFVDFVTALPPRVEELVLFGRLDPERGRFPHELPAGPVRFVALPHYPNVRDLRAVAAAFRRSLSTFDAGLASVDAVWLFGPHPLALAFARRAHRRGIPVAIGVRQDFPEYVRSRARWALPGALALERAWRRVGRRAPAVVVGDALARNYAGGAPVLSTGFSLIRDADVAARPEPDWAGELRLLTVGRLSPEKNPLLLADIVARLDERWRLDVVGEGPLRDALEARARELGVRERMHFEGYVPAGPALRERYRGAHAFLHVSSTEGVPQVIFEAQSAGLPVVATDVGGVAGAFGGSALLVPPGDASAAAAGVERLRTDEEERTRLSRLALAHAREETLEAQLDRVAAFLRQQLG